MRLSLGAWIGRALVRAVSTRESVAVMLAMQRCGRCIANMTAVMLAMQRWKCSAVVRICHCADWTR